jgi:hypothetical protein
MFVNAILHHEVPAFDEKIAKFLYRDASVIPSGCLQHGGRVH